MTKWLIAGSSGMVGRGIVRIAKSQGISDIVEVSSKTCDLRNLQKTRELLLDTKPDVVIDAAAKVGGILANSTEPVDFMINNLQIQTNLFSASHEANVRKVVFLSSSCVYPKLAEQPIKESSLLTGSLEETNSAYAVAKIAGMRLIQAYRQQFNRNWISVMPTNLFGTFDNFSTTTSHFLPALIRKFHDAKVNSESKVTLWGSGKPKRELMEVDEFTRALLLIVEKYDDAETINIGTGEDLSIKEISEMVKNVVGFQGEVIWDESKPDGTPRKLLDITKITSLGYQPNEDLKTGITKTYDWFKQELVNSKSDMRL
jgi:GDP-L-fucose synthase